MSSSEWKEEKKKKIVEKEKVVKVRILKKREIGESSKD